MTRPLHWQRVYLLSGDVTLVANVLTRIDAHTWTVNTCSDETVTVKSSDPYRPLVWEEIRTQQNRCQTANPEVPAI